MEGWLQTLVPVVVGLAVMLVGLWYKGLVTYDITTMQRTFEECGAVPVDADVPSWSSLVMERITIKNRGWADVADFSIHIPDMSPLSRVAITDTTTLSEEIITVKVVGKVLEISTKQLPRGESITVETAFRALRYPSYLRTAKGGSGKYRFKPQRGYERDLKDFKAALGWGFASLVIFYALTRQEPVGVPRQATKASSIDHDQSNRTLSTHAINASSFTAPA